jgi:hypothetical protein
MILSWLEFWPKEFNLVVYTEGFTLAEKDPRLVEIDLETTCPDIVIFKNHSKKMLDLADTKKEKSRIEKTVKWCHKVYAMAHALQYTIDDYLIFLDGDTYTVTHLPNTLPFELVTTHLFAVHFEKLKGKLHFETGLVVFNLGHEKRQWLANILTTGYDSLEIYNMDKTWDGFWFAHLYTKYKLPVKNLSEQSSKVFGHPLIYMKLRHDVGTKKYLNAGYNKFTGRKVDV